MSPGPEPPQTDPRALIAERLRAGLLPVNQGQRVFAGHGDGTQCTGCGHPIGQRDIQYDVDHREPGRAGAGADEADVGGAARSLAMHLQCYRLWVELSEGPVAR